MRELVERFKQPSSWAGLGLLWSVFGPKYIPWDLIVNFGVALAALLAVVLREPVKS